MQQLSLHLAENLAELDARFGASADYYAKEIMIYHCRGCIVLFDGMASLDSLWELLLDAASRQALQRPCPCTGQEVYERILHGSASPAESTPVEDLPDLVKRLTAGMAVLLLDGCAKGIAFSVQALKYRSVDEPEGEGNLRGSREGFADLLRVNLSLLRRLVRTDDLVLEVAQADTAAGTEYAICYCRGKADPAMVRQVRQTLAAAKPELLLDSSYFVPWLLPSRARLFTPVSYTQRPAAASAKLCEGRIVVLVNGSPSAMVLPALFCENFECLDDYASTAVFASFLRGLNYASFYLTVFLPGAFVCLAVYLPELIPPQLLYKIEAAEKATPLPLFAEMLLVILLLEVIREAGLRMPQSLEHSGHLCGQHYVHCGVRHARFVRTGHPAAHRRSGGCGACRAGGTGRGFFCAAAQPVRHRDAGGAVSCTASVPAKPAGRGRRHPAQLSAPVPQGVQHLAKTEAPRMNKTQDKFSVPAVTLSIFAAAAAERLPVCSSPRALLWQEVLAAVLLMILSALASRFWQSGPPKPAAWAAAFCLQVWLAVELAGTFWKALQVCREEFSSLALLGFLPLLLWAGWQMPARAWGAPAQVLWWFVAVGSAVCLLGLSRQMHWAGLFAQAAPQSTAFTVPIYAEYFAVPLLCGREERRGVCLPILTALVQTAATLGMALVFGRTYPARELLRAWSTGTFSRLDAALLLVWLTCAIFRIGVLCTAVRMLGQEYAIQKRKEVRQ